MRAEVQQAVASLKNEASNISEGKFNQAKQGQLASKMTKVAENLQQAEKDALVKLRDVLTHANWDLSDRLDKQMQVNNQLGEHVNSSWEKILEVVTRLDMKMVTLESYVTESEERISKKISEVHSNVKSATSHLSTESRKILENTTEHLYDIKSAVENSSTEMQTALSAEIKSSGNKVTQAIQHTSDIVQASESKIGKVLDVQQALESAASKLTSDMSKMQRQDDRHYTDLGMSLDNMKSDQTMQMCEITTHFNDIEKHFSPVHDNIVKIRKKVTNDTKLVLGEIGKLQKAMQVDYVSFGGSRAGITDRQDPEDQEEASDEEDLSKSKRCRDLSIQTELAQFKDTSVMTDPVKFEDEHKKKNDKKKKKDNSKQEEAHAKMKKNAFGGADKLKEQATAAAMKKQYNVFDYYWEAGWSQWIARSPKFDNLTLSLVLVNSIWIAVDLDLNDADLIVDAHPVFIIAENLFCLYFFGEVIIRFGAFQKKRNAFKDPWFIFDFTLVTLMVLETWVLTIVVLASGSRFTIPGGTTMFRMIRLVRLLRLTRLTKLLRAIPELAIIMKGLAFASRSVGIFFVLWMVIVYLFSILFNQFMRGSAAGHKYFSTVPEGINTLFLYGVFGSQAPMMNEVTAGQPWLWPILVFFFMLVSLTVMYMLLGVLVDVISAVATSEKQKIEVSYIVGQLRDEIETMGHSADDMSLTQLEFQNIIMEPGIVKVMTEAGVDVVVLADMLELVFEDINTKGDGRMTFTDLVNIVLNMRGGNPATVKDSKEQIRVTKSIFKLAIDELTDEINEQFKMLRQEISALEVGDEDDDD
eukprot:TRINITY_DN23578_c0_g1_i1.p1 TRINITY_DN23578_c0_g1~~TRINITY_DN23578_c0_g1_i1.p1  ORF type:complete len:898 (+),score=206.83 TRINITY_DN23578_c0_g1_i1:263-2695(+)